MLWILTRFITYYALTNDANEEVKDLCYERLIVSRLNV